MAKTAIKDEDNEEREPINHKGKPCPYLSLTCQEGWCVECGIFEQWCKSLWTEKPDD